VTTVAVVSMLLAVLVSAWPRRSKSARGLQHDQRRRAGGPSSPHNIRTQPQTAGHEQQRDWQKAGHRPGAPLDGADKPRGGTSDFLRRLAPRCPSRSMKAFGAFLALACVAGAQGPVAEGDLALGEGRYADAIRLYLEAQERAGADAGLLVGLGDAYAGAGDVGRAVLGYERALLLAPRDGTVRDSLEGLRRRSGLEGDLGRGWRDFHRYLTRGEWTAVGVAAAGLLLVAFAGRRRLARQALIRLTLLGLIIGLPAATANARLAFERDRAIVVARESVELRLSPYRESETTGSLRSGKVVWITRSFADFARVRSPQGAVGWVPRACVEAVIP
jgi:tetratricopeptide (TPR) repeat protein